MSCYTARHASHNSWPPFSCDNLWSLVAWSLCRSVRVNVCVPLCLCVVGLMSRITDQLYRCPAAASSPGREFACVHLFDRSVHVVQCMCRAVW